MKNQNQTLDDKSVLLNLQLRRLGNSRKVSTSDIEVDADKSMVRVNKMLLDSPELDAIKSHDGYTRTWLYSRALPSMFKEGVFRVPNGLVNEVVDYLKKRANDRQGLVKAFKQAYPKRVSEALERLNGIGKVSDYLDAESAAAHFSMDWMFLSFSTPDTLKALRAGLFEEQKAKMAENIKAAGDEIKQVLRVQMAKLVERMVTQLQPSADGKRRKIHDSLVGNIDDFLSTFDARNIADDSELKKLTSRARDILKGVDPEILRNAEDVRKDVQGGFEKIKQQLDTMIVDKPSRQFDFTE